MFDNFGEYFFSFEGRLGRLSYLWRLLLVGVAGSVGFLALGAATLVLLIAAAPLGLAIFVLGGLAIFAATLWAQVAIAARRYHDFGWSGKVQFVTFGLAALHAINGFMAVQQVGGFAAWEQAMAAAKSDPHQLANLLASARGHSLGVVGLLCTLVGLGMSLQLLFWPGDKGENRYDGPQGGARPAPAPEGRSSSAPVYAPRAPMRPAVSIYEPRATFGLKRSGA